ncbi:MAG: SGNH/GDSL hydrolase family protein [Clostridiales bacterium]|nr:SGNH/GDSL hydrolase family protein [Clostridiales bacterium]
MKIKSIALILIGIMLLAGCNKVDDVSDPSADSGGSTTSEQAEPEEEFDLDKGITSMMKKRSIINEGDLSRLAKVIKKAQAGDEEVVIGVIGGSITQGSLAQNNKGYATLMQEWWESKFPNTEFRFINAGIGATDSYIGVHRVNADLLESDPDLVIVEFSVNDTRAHINKDSYEALVRTILSHKSEPAAMLLFTTQEDGTSFQDTHAPIGEHYNLPMISYKDAILPVISAEHIKWTDISPDNIHPNDEGHDIIKQLLSSFLDDVVSKVDEIDGEYILPEANSDKYEGAFIANAKSEEITVLETGSFEPDAQFGSFKDGWAVKEGSDPLVFEVEAKNLGVLYMEFISGKGAKAEILVNGEVVKTIDADFPNGWGNYAESVEVYASDKVEKLKVEIRPVDDEERTQFTVLGIMVS